MTTIGTIVGMVAEPENLGEWVADNRSPVKPAYPQARGFPPVSCQPRHPAIH